MKKTGKSGLGHLKKVEKQERQVVAGRARIEMMPPPRPEKKPRRRMA